MSRQSFVVVAALLMAGAPAAAEPWRLGDPLQPEALDSMGGSLSFTPRVPGVFDIDNARVTLTYRPVDAGQIEASPADQASANQPRDGFVFGGALAIDDFRITGQMAQTDTGFVETDGIDASIEIGGFTTRMGYAQIDGGGGEVANRFGLGADLDTAPGVSVGADLSYEDAEGAEREDEAAGVVRFRLSF